MPKSSGKKQRDAVGGRRRGHTAVSTAAKNVVYTLGWDAHLAVRSGDGLERSSGTRKLWCMTDGGLGRVSVRVFDTQKVDFQWGTPFLKVKRTTQTKIL